MAKQLESGVKISRGWLGVVIQEVTADLADSFGLDRPRGALVSQVQSDSPAQRAGLRPADVILEFNGKAVEDSNDLPRMVGMAKPGTKIPLQIWRKGKLQQLSVVLGELPAENQQVGNSGKATLRGGLALSELGADQRRALDLDYGVLVADATGEAARAGIRTGDIILAVNNTRIASVEDYRKAIAADPDGKSAAILVRRGDGTLYIPLKISGG